jgi:para-nitrobenzyl esterase
MNDAYWPPVARTDAGRLRGVWTDGVAAFKGVPYAAPPVGPARFRPAEPPEPWDGLRNCATPGPVCPQVPVSTPRYAVDGPRDEDCLSLNVWTPNVDRERRPVVVFLHGGGYWAGAGSVAVYDGAAYARAGAVCVTLNYRLGAFGFLYLDELFGDLAHTGNLGVLDVVRALEWVRDNIAGFGGDPDRVLVTGSSAGGISVSALMAMDGARGLMRRAAPVSCAAGRARDPETATATARIVIEHLGVRPGDTEALLALPADRLVPDAALIGKIAAAGGDLGFGPVVDGDVLRSDPLTAVAAGSAAGVDLLIGTTADELGGRHTSVLGAEEALALDDIPLPRPAPEALDLRAVVPAGASAERVAELYRDELRAAGRPAEPLDVALAARGDLLMTVPTLDFAAAHAPHAPTFVFRFAWPSPGHGGALGAFHGLATPFSFGNLDDPLWREALGDAPPRTLADDVLGAMVAFAGTGDPGHAGLPAWPRWTPEDRATMTFDLPSHLHLDPRGAHLRALRGA